MLPRPGDADGAFVLINRALSAVLLDMAPKTFETGTRVKDATQAIVSEALETAIQKMLRCHPARHLVVHPYSRQPGIRQRPGKIDHWTLQLPHHPQVLRRIHHADDAVAVPAGQ